MKQGKFLSIVKEHKKGTAVLAGLLVLCVAGGICAAVFLGKNQETIVEEEPKEEPVEVEFTVEDLSGVVTGLDGEAYVLAGTDMDYLSLLAYDDSIVTGITPKTEELDVNTVADYQIQYLISVDAKALCEYLEKDFPENGAEDAEITAEKEISIVDQTTAQFLADAGTVVYNGTGSTVAKTDGTAITAEVAAPESAASTGGSSKSGDTAPKATTNKGTASTGTSNKGSSGNSTSGTTTNGNTGSGGTSGSGTTTKPAGGSSSNSGTTQKPSGGSSGSGSGGSSGGGMQTHQHTWGPQYTTVYHPAVTHQEEIKVLRDVPVYEYHIYCKVCDHLFFNNVDEAIVHSGDTGHGYASGDVQVGTEKKELGTGQYKTVVDQEAWNEQVPNGEKCSTCGATR